MWNRRIAATEGRRHAAANVIEDRASVGDASFVLAMPDPLPSDIVARLRSESTAALASKPLKPAAMLSEMPLMASPMERRVGKAFGSAPARMRLVERAEG